MSPLVEQNGPDTDVLDDSETEELEHVVEARIQAIQEAHGVLEQWTTRTQRCRHKAIVTVGYTGLCTRAPPLKS